MRRDGAGRKDGTIGWKKIQVPIDVDFITALRQSVFSVEATRRNMGDDKLDPKFIGAVP
jgi:hypothetical protein